MTRRRRALALATESQKRHPARNLPDSYEWYRQRALSLAGVQPNPAHFAIARLESQVPELTLVTQNIDRLSSPLLQRAARVPQSSIGIR